MSRSTSANRQRHPADLRLVQLWTDAYTDLADRRLAASLAREDLAEERGLSPHERITCRLHRRWIHECIASPRHAIPVTGHRWCYRCQVATSIAVDELAGSVRLTCPRCGQLPANRASRQIIRTCKASLAAAREYRAPERRASA